jgi:predicted phosphodiesterase
MRIAILSDIHANYSALMAVEKDYKKSKCQALWMLGDAFGRGPHPEAIYQWMKSNFNNNAKPVYKLFSGIPIIRSFYRSQINNCWVVGNHDAHIFGWDKFDGDELIPYPIRIIDEDHRIKLTKFSDFPTLYGQRERLLSLSIDMDGFQYILTHEFKGFGYIYPWDSPALNSLYQSLYKEILGTIVLFGHTHIPLLARVDPMGSIESIKIETCRDYYLSNNFFWFINPGSVGSPADLDTRASYAILDTQQKTINYKKVSYGLEEVSRDMLKNNYAPIVKDQLETANLPRLDIPDDWYDYYQKARKDKCSHE